MLSAAEMDMAIHWARVTAFTPAQLDCITAIMLKILDRKCKMDSRAQTLVTVVYSVTRQRLGGLFSESHHAVIQAALLRHHLVSSMTIHKMRLYAEAAIAKPEMKNFKAFLRQSLLAEQSQISSIATS